MKGIRLFEQALGLEHPWYVDKTEFEPKTGKLDLHLNFEAGGMFECGGCGGEGRKAYDTAWKRWRHLNFFQHEAFLHAPAPRVKCPSCGIRRARLPWARPRSGFTLLFVGAGDDDGGADAGPGAGAHRRRTRHAAVAGRQTLRGRSEGGRRSSRRAGRGSGREGVPPGPRLRHVLRGCGRAESAECADVRALERTRPLRGLLVGGVLVVRGESHVGERPGALCLFVAAVIGNGARGTAHEERPVTAQPMLGDDTTQKGTKRRTKEQESYEYYDRPEAERRARIYREEGDPSAVAQRVETTGWAIAVRPSWRLCEACDGVGWSRADYHRPCICVHGRTVAYGIVPANSSALKLNRHRLGFDLAAPSLLATESDRLGRTHAQVASALGFPGDSQAPGV